MLERRETLLLTHKQSLVDSKLPIITSYHEIEENCVVDVYIKEVTNDRYMMCSGHVLA